MISPLIGIEVTGPLPDLSAARGLIFTSANGVRAYLALGGRLDLPVYAVGGATALVAREAGMSCESTNGNAQGLISWLIEKRPTSPLCHMRGTHARGNVSERLSAAELPTSEAIIYDQPALALSEAAKTALAGKAPVVVPLYSPRSAALLSEKLRIRPPQAPLLVAALSEAVANAATSPHIMVMKTAPSPCSAHMLPMIAQLLEQAGQEGSNRA